MKRRMKIWSRRAWALTLAVLLGGCAVGPDFERPAPPAATNYGVPLSAPTASAAGVAGAAQHFVVDGSLAEDWWQQFRCAPLNSLIAEALAASPSVQAAEAALRVAQETTAAQRGAWWPSAGLSGGPTRQKSPDLLSPPLASGDSLYTLHTAQLNIAYAPDVFGGNRRQVESLAAQEDVQRQQLRAAQVSLTANLVMAVVQAASLREQIAVTESTRALLSEQLTLVNKQFAAGAIAQSNVIAQEGLLAQTEASLLPLEKQLAQQGDLIAVLAGHAPGTIRVPPLTLADLHLPEQLPVTLPSQLVRQRPDILAAEAQWQAANAQIGVATANLFPQFSITAGAGSSALSIGSLFSAGTGFWSLAANVTQPLFQGGQLIHRRRGAQANAEQAAALYRATVLAGLQSVADTLHAIRFDAQTLAAAEHVERSAADTLAIVRRQLALGDVSYLATLQADQAWQQARLATAQARAARLADSVALFQALGGNPWRERTSQSTRTGEKGAADSSVTTPDPAEPGSR